MTPSSSLQTWGNLWEPESGELQNQTCGYNVREHILTQSFRLPQQGAVMVDIISIVLELAVTLWCVHFIEKKLTCDSFFLQNEQGWVCQGVV